MLTVLTVWICLSLPVAMVVAAIGKAGLREEEARHRIAGPSPAAYRGGHDP